MGNTICAQLQVARPTVSRWLDPYAADGLVGFETGALRAARPKQITVANKASIVERIRQTVPFSGLPLRNRFVAGQKSERNLGDTTLFLGHIPRRIRHIHAKMG